MEKTKTEPKNPIKISKHQNPPPPQSNPDKNKPEKQPKSPKNPNTPNQNKLKNIVSPQEKKFKMYWEQGD